MINKKIREALLLGGAKADSDFQIKLFGSDS